MEYKLLSFKKNLELTCQKVIKRRVPNSNCSSTECFIARCSSQLLRKICRTLCIPQLDLVFFTVSVILLFLAISRLFNVFNLAKLFNFWFAALFFILDYYLAPPCHVKLPILPLCASEEFKTVEDFLHLSLELEGECFCWLPLTQEL